MQLRAEDTRYTAKKTYNVQIDHLLWWLMSIYFPREASVVVKSS